MKVLALVSEAYGAGGGIAQYNRDVFAAMARSGQRPTIDVLPRRARADARPRPEGVRQHQSRPGKAAYALGAGLFALRTRPDIIFCGHLFMAPLAATVARLTGARLLIQLHGIEIWEQPSPAMKRALESAALVFCVSRDTRRRLLAWADVAPERAVVLANTVGEAFIPGDRAAARARFGLGAERVLLSVGRLDARERYKGQDRVIAALPALLAQGLDITYLIAGDGDDQPRLEALAHDAGVAERVRFLGQITEADLPVLYRAADLFVLPSTGEGFGIVFLEAMASGTPALGLAAGGAVDALIDGVFGRAVGEDALGSAIARQLSSPNYDRADGSARTRARFGAEPFAKRIEQLMLRLGETGAAKQ